MSRLIPINQVIVADDRQRQTFTEKPLAELVNSIASKGLLHPPVLKNDGQTLVAGERRLRAIIALHESGTEFLFNGEPVPQGMLPFTLVGQLTPYELREAEFEENILREDLTWQEKQLAIAGLHELRSEQRAEVDEFQTLDDTAKEIARASVDGTAVRNAGVIVKHLDDPDVINAGDPKKALKVIRKKLEAQKRRELAQTFETNVTSEQQFYILHADSFAVVPTLQEKTVDIIIADPPYGVGADEFNDQAAAAHKYADDLERAIDCYTFLFSQAARVTKDEAFIFAFCDIRRYPLFCDIANELLSPAGFRVWDTPLIWYKQSGMLPIPDYGPRRTFEAIIYAYRARERRWLPSGTHDVFTARGLTKPLFGAQKPPELYQEILSKVARPGDLILDPFAGSGPVIQAAKQLNALAICIEENEEKADYMKAQLIEAEAEAEDTADDS